MRKLAIITSHPIQYNAPLFRLLTERGNIQVKVFYTWEQSKDSVFDPDFGFQRKWDIPLLNGYDSVFLKNVSRNPGSHHFRGINNPDSIRIIKEYRPDWMMIYGWSFIGHIKLINEFGKKIPIIFRGDSNLLDEKEGFSFKKLARSIFLKWLYSKIDIALYYGNQNKKYFKKYGLRDNQLVFGPHAIENSRFSSMVDSKNIDKLRQQLKIPSNNFIFLFAGKFQLKKDPLILLKSFISIQQGDVHLIFAGDGTLKQEMMDASKNEPNIHFLNFQNQSEMPALYSICDVFVLPSAGPGETWGLAINEAMASGKAVITSNKTGGAVDLVINDFNGFIFTAGNEEQLTKQLKYFVDNRHKAAEFGANSLKLIQNWNYTLTAENIELVVNQKLKN